MKGSIKVVKADRGFFFIKRSDGGSDVFGHAKDLAPDSGLVFGEHLVGLSVEFNVVEGAKGPAAKDIRRAR